MVVEHLHQDHNGQPIHVEVHAYPIFDQDENVIQMIEYTIDITKRKNAEKEIKSRHREIVMRFFIVLFLII